MRRRVAETMHVAGVAWAVGERTRRGSTTSGWHHPRLGAFAPAPRRPRPLVHRLNQALRWNVGGRAPPAEGSGGHRADQGSHRDREVRGSS